MQTPHEFDLQTYLEAQALDFLYLMDDMETLTHNVLKEYKEIVHNTIVNPHDTTEQGEKAV